MRLMSSASKATLWSRGTASFLALVLGLGLGAVPEIASAALHTSGAQEITFTASGTAGLHIVGTTHEVAVNDDGTNITVRAQLAHLTTGIELRDNHTRDHLDVQHFPFTELKVARSAVQFPAGAATSGEAHGELTIHGQTKPVTFHYTATPESGGIRVTAELSIKMTDFGIEQPTYMGIGVKKEVAIAVHLNLRDQ